VSSSVTWSVATSSIASINSSGLATAKSAGSTSVTASLSGMSGSATLTVDAVTVTKTLTSLTVTPATASIQVGVTQQFAATANYSDGSTQIVTSTGAVWSVSSSSVATISSSTGLATAVSAGLTTVTATYSGVSGSAALTAIAVPVTSIAVAPTSSDLTVGGTQQFTATATYANGTTANVSSQATWSVSASGIVAINAGLGIAVGAGTTGVTASYSGFNSSATVDVSNATFTGANIPLFHVDQNRSGTNPNESILTPANVTTWSFGKLFSYLVDGYVYGQPLLVSNLTIGNGTTHNVLFAATENDSVYAFDADSNAGSNANPLWQVSLLQTGETPITDGPIQPVEGITSTPAIDLTTNTMYVVSTQTSASAGGTFRLNALNITTGQQMPGSPITLQASVPGTNDTTLSTSCLQRAALLVLPGTPVFIGFGSCHSGWLLAYTYNGQAFAQTGVFNMSPNLVGEGPYASAGGVWMGGGGPVSDGNYVYVTTGNGPWDGQTAFGDSVLKFSQTLQLEDYFTPFVYAYMDCADADLAAGGLLLIPGTTELLAGGKTGKLYLVNTDNLGQEQTNDTGATQTLWFEEDLEPPYESTCTSTGTESGSAYINSYEIFGTSAYFNGSGYLGVTPTSSTAVAPVRQFPYSGTLSYGGYTQPNILEGSYGTTPFISANGTSNGILWMIDHGQPLQSGSTQTSATLRAYNPNNLSGGELYNSNANAGDVPGYGIKFTAPIAANGKVYVSTGHNPVTTPSPQGELDVYGLK
jgi:Bacterial Ig-like domain (group 2)